MLVGLPMRESQRVVVGCPALRFGWVTAAIALKFDFPDRFLDVSGPRAGFVLLAAFLVSFLFIRTSARLIRSPKVPW